MRMTREDVFTAIGAFLLIGMMVAVCVKHEMTTITINHATYVQAGLMASNDNGHEIFVPVYLRQQ